MVRKSAAVQALAICAIACLPAVGQALYWRDRVSWKQPPAADEITVAAAAAAGKSVLWLDARPSPEYARSHIPSAMPLTAEQWDELLPNVLGAWSPGEKIVVYCSSKDCNASREVARRLREEAALKNVFVLQGGWEAWQSRPR